MEDLDHIPNSQERRPKRRKVIIVIIVVALLILACIGVIIAITLSAEHHENGTTGENINNALIK